MDILSPEFRERLARLRIAVSKLGNARRRGPHPSRARGVGLEFAGHRAYSPGDDVRFLDWNALGRLEQLVLKQFEAPGELTVVLALDPSPTMDFGQPNKLSHAREVLAAIGDIGLMAGDRVVVAPLTADAFEPRSFAGLSAEAPMLARLAEKLPRQALRSPEAWIDAATARRGDVLVVVGTDFQNREPLLALLDNLRQGRARVLVIQHIAEQELHAPSVGHTRLGVIGSAGETNVALEVTPELAVEYERELNLWRAAVASACRRAGAGHLEVGTHGRIEEIIPALVGAGVLRLRRG